MTSSYLKHFEQIVASATKMTMSAEITAWRALLIGTASFFTVLTTAVFGYHLHISLPRSGEAPVIWSWFPLLGCAIELGMEPVKFLQKNAQKYKDIFGFIAAGHRTFIVCDPHSHSVILKPTTKALSFREFHEMLLINFFGSSNATIQKHSYDDDRARKQFSNYLLSDSALHKLTTRMQQYMHRNVASTTAGAVFDLYDFIGRIIFKASIAALINDAAADEEGLYEAFMTFDEHMAIAAGGVNMNLIPAVKKCRDLLLQACRTFKGDDNCELLQKRWADFLELEKKNMATSTDVNSWQLAIVWASVGNTMPGTFWVLYYLLNDMQLLLRVKDEVRNAVGKSNGVIELSQEQLNRLTFTDACITETFRLTTGSLIMRFVQKPIELTLSSGRTYRFRTGDRVGLCPPIHHHDADIFPDPEKFDPMRWMIGDTPEALALSSHGKLPLKKDGKIIGGDTGYLAFGGGITYCPGRRFARNEIKTLLAYIVLQFDFQFVAPPSLAPSGSCCSGSIDANGKFVPEYPEQDGGRAGIGIFQPKKKVFVKVDTI